MAQSNIQRQAGLAVNFQRYFTSKAKIKALMIWTGDWRKGIISSLARPLTGRSEPSARSAAINELFLQMRQAKIWEEEAE